MELAYQALRHHQYYIIYTSLHSHVQGSNYLACFDIMEYLLINAFLRYRLLLKQSYLYLNLLYINIYPLYPAYDMEQLLTQSRRKLHFRDIRINKLVGCE